MEVVFKLTPEQLERARSIVKKVEKEEEEGYDPDARYLSWCGNLLGMSGHSFGFNSNQNLELNEDAGTITYKGERHPLEQDGGLTVLYKVVLGEIPEFPWRPHESGLQKAWSVARLEAVKRLRVVLYKTSDTRMEWWETMWDVAWRMTPEELLQEILTGQKTGGWKVAPSAIVSRCREIMEKYRDVEPGTPEYRRMLASGQQVEWRIAKILSKTH